jgi:hypothetical protein
MGPFEVYHKRKNLLMHNDVLLTKDIYHLEIIYDNDVLLTKDIYYLEIIY